MRLTTVGTDGPVAVVAVAGDLDVFTAPDLRAHMTELIEAGHRHLVIDLKDLAFIDSTGIGALVGVLKRARVHDGSVHLVCTHERIIALFRMTLLPRDLPTHDTVADALAAAR